MRDEYAAGIQYINHANRLKGAAFTDIAKHLIEHAFQEFDHASTDAEILKYYGTPAVIEISPVSVSNDNLEMLRQNKAFEETAISLYDEIQKELELAGDPGNADKIRQIIIQEQEHKLDLITALGE